MIYQLFMIGVLSGHAGWVTQIATTPETRDMIISASRDRSLIVWKLTRGETRYGFAAKVLHGHTHFVSDVALSSDGQFALSGSWDKTLRLWDLTEGTTTRRFEGHDDAVLSVAFSADNRRIASGSRDNTIKLWDTMGQCKYTIQADEGGHTAWVSSVRFSPDSTKHFLVSGGFDKLVKMWDLTTLQLMSNFYGHTSYINSVAVTPDGSLCASGGRDGNIMVWDLGSRKYLYNLDAADTINALVFSPTRYWLAAATGTKIQVWDLESKTLVDELYPDIPNGSDMSHAPVCISLAWSADGETLFAGYTDKLIRVFQVSGI